MIFDGKAFAEKLISALPRKKTKLAIFLSKDNDSGARYVKIKTETAKRLGVEIVMNKIDGDEDGIMVQLPHPQAQKIIAQIPPEKDVDGLREDSKYLPAAVLAVEKILNAYSSESMVHRRTIVIGAKGFIGQRIIKLLRTMNYELITEMDKDNFDPEKIKLADIVISATGSPSLIKDVKEGAVCVDLGFPKGDFDPMVAKKAGFFTPVPGGVGPVTVACLFENLLTSVPKV